MSADAEHAGANGAPSAAEFDMRAVLGADGIGGRTYIAACAHDAISLEPEDHSAEKCNVCAHRPGVGVEREPARV